jgi:hypothetical protein
LTTINDEDLVELLHALWELEDSIPISACDFDRDGMPTLQWLNRLQQQGEELLAEELERHKCNLRCFITRGCIGENLFLVVRAERHGVMVMESAQPLGCLHLQALEALADPDRDGVGGRKG